MTDDPRTLSDEQWASAVEQLKAWQFDPAQYDHFMTLAQTMTELTMNEFTESVLRRKRVKKILWGFYSTRLDQVSRMLQEQLAWAKSVNQGYDA